MSNDHSLFPIAKMSSATSATVTKTPKQRKGTSGKNSLEAKAAKDANDFFWTYTEEPHRTRRMAIIKAHPEVIANPR